MLAISQAFGRTCLSSKLSGSLIMTEATSIHGLLGRPVPEAGPSVEDEQEPEEPSWELAPEVADYKGDPTDRKALLQFRQAQQAARQVRPSDMLGLTATRASREELWLQPWLCRNWTGTGRVGKLLLGSAQSGGKRSNGQRQL